TLTLPLSSSAALPFDDSVGLVGGFVALAGTIFAWYFVPARAADADTARDATVIANMRFVNTISSFSRTVNRMSLAAPPRGAQRRHVDNEWNHAKHSHSVVAKKNLSPPKAILRFG